jgi:hypothetical protein
VLARLSALCAFVALIVVVAGCGGGGSSSGTSSSQSPGSPETDKTTFIEEADAVCTRYQAERKSIKVEIEALESVAELESPANMVKLGGLLNKALSNAGVELESIRELAVPSGDEATIERMLAINSKATKIAEGYGLKVCGQSPRV